MNLCSSISRQCFPLFMSHSPSSPSSRASPSECGGAAAAAAGAGAVAAAAAFAVSSEGTPALARAPASAFLSLRCRSSFLTACFSNLRGASAFEFSDRIQNMSSHQDCLNGQVQGLEDIGAVAW